MESTDSNQECKIGYKNFTNGVSQCLAYTRKLGNRRSSKDYIASNPQMELIHHPGWGYRNETRPQVSMPPLQKILQGIR